MPKKSAVQYMATPPKRTPIAKALIAKLETQVNMELAEVRFFFEMIATAISDYFADIDWQGWEAYEEQCLNGPPGTISRIYSANRRLIAAVRLYEDARRFFLSHRFKYIASVIGLDWEYVQRIVLAGDAYLEEVAA